MAQYFISGTGGFIVGKYDVSNLAYYMLALTMINAIVGVIGALINPIIQPIVKLNSLQRKDDVDKLVITLSFLFGLFIIVGVNISHYISEFVLSIWIGIDKAEQTNIIFNYLLVAFAIRMVISPYGMKMVSEGRQLSISHYPLAEGVLNFFLSIYFVSKYGALGIAYATTCAALVLMLAYIYRYTLDCNLDKKYILVSISFFILPLAAVINVFFLESSKLYSNVQTVMIIQLLVLIPVVIFIIRGIKNVKRLVNSI
ncbi:TPA: polysaccharide biosynthesis protein [Aeromonas dhakensis]|nr:polysaccharide biosynthesis protein [Aeromonas dhakensis]HDZ8897955.1 polysaccharide biosynthesis protein [Aeromonas dhakensis]